MAVSKFIQIRRDLHKIPEIGFKEWKTQQYILDYIGTLSNEHVEVKVWETGVIVKVNGKNPEKIIGYRADIDGLPITEETGYEFASIHEGMMHACGHDVHTTIGLGLLTAAVTERIDDDLVFLFQPAEEGPGGALPMLESEELKEWKPNIILGLHIAPEYPVGTIATKEGLLFANTSELYVDLKGKGGHAAYPHTANDMIVAASHLVTQLQSVISRNVNPLDSAVIIAGIEASFHCEAVIDYGAMYHQVYNHEALTREFMQFVSEQTDMKVITCTEAMTGEDFGYMLQEIPGFMFWLGVNSEYGLHHAKLKPDEEAIEKAIVFLDQYVKWKGTRK